MTTPYDKLSNYQFHSKEMVGVHPSRFDPIVSTKINIDKNSKIMTMGSCFAQNLTKWLIKNDFGIMVEEADEQHGGLFSANYGNVYTVAQALQLFHRAFGNWNANEELYQSEQGYYVDPLRPSAIAGGFETTEVALARRNLHESRVKSLFLTAEVLVFTLGLTEAWIRKSDNAVLPIAPGVVAGQFSKDLYDFKNFSFEEVKNALSELINEIYKINPHCQILLTVSPVPLAATYENKHISVASMASKSILRAVVEDVIRCFDHVDYFPSYEVFLTPGIGDGYFEYDNRHVKPAGVEHAMRLFEKHYANKEFREDSNKISSAKLITELYNNVICDEEKIANS